MRVKNTNKTEISIEEFKVIDDKKEPKIKRGFEFLFPENLGIPSYLIQTVERPSAKLNSFKKLEWNPIEIQMLETTDNSTLKGVMKIQEPDLIDKGFNCKLRDLDFTGVTLNEWTLLNCRIESVHYGHLDYASSSLTLISIQIKPEKCTIKF